MSSPYTMQASELPPSSNVKPKTSFPPSLAFTYTLDGTVRKAMNFTGTLYISECSATDFQYWSIAPIGPNGWALLGELDKVVSVSKTRFDNLITVGRDIHFVYLSGVPGEKVTITAYDVSTGVTEANTCTINSSGTISLMFPYGPCI